MVLGDMQNNQEFQKEISDIAWQLLMSEVSTVGFFRMGAFRTARVIPCCLERSLSMTTYYGVVYDRSCE